jgi:hypothetical protein
MIAELRTERESIEQANPASQRGRIEDVEDRQHEMTLVKRRGRPPGSKNKARNWI